MTAPIIHRNRSHRRRIWTPGSGGGGGSEIEIPGSGNEANHRFWLDATRLTGTYTDNDSMGTWEDLLGVQDFVQTTASNRPLFKSFIQNGNPAVLFDGADDCMDYGTNSTALNDVDGDFTLWAAFKLNITWPSAQVVFHKGDGATAAGTAMEISNWNGYQATYAGYAVGSNYNTLSPGNYTEDTSWHTYIWVRSGSSFELYYDNGSTATATSTLSGSINDVARIPRIGKSCVNTYPLSGYIGELGLIAEAFSASQILTRYNVMAAKWL